MGPYEAIFVVALCAAGGVGIWWWGFRLGVQVSTSAWKSERELLRDELARARQQLANQPSDSGGRWRKKTPGGSDIDPTHDLQEPDGRPR